MRAHPPAHTVGVSTHEALLTAAVVQRPHDVLAGDIEDEALVVLEEVELGIGRPDLIVLTVDLRTLTLRKAAGLRLRNLTDARTLGAMLSDEPESSGVSRDYYRRVSDYLVSLGWLNGHAVSQAVHDSILIEAKVSHWGKGVQQLARVRWASHAAALLVPDTVASQIPRAMLSYNGLGLLTQDSGRLTWRRTSPRVALPLHVDAWLGELAIRSLTG